MNDTDIEFLNIGLMLIFGASFLLLPWIVCRLGFNKVDIFNIVLGGTLLISGIACALVRWLL